MTDGTSPRLDGRRARRNRKRVDVRPAPMPPGPPNVRTGPMLPPPIPDPCASVRDLGEALLACALSMDATTRAGGRDGPTGLLESAYDLLAQAHDKLAEARVEETAELRRLADIAGKADA